MIIPPNGMVVRMLKSELGYLIQFCVALAQALLRDKNLKRLPNQEQVRYLDWDGFLLAVLEQAAKELKGTHSTQSAS